MNIVFENTAIGKGYARYYVDEFSLEYEHSQNAKLDNVVINSGDIACRPCSPAVEPFFLIADTLTITFSNQAKEFRRFDSYTNWKLWIPSPELRLPDRIEVGVLRLTELPPDDRIDLQVVPNYSFNEERELLEIRLVADSYGMKYVRVSDVLVVGILGNSIGLLLLERLSKSL